MDELEKVAREAWDDDSVLSVEDEARIERAHARVLNFAQVDAAVRAALPGVARVTVVEQLVIAWPERGWGLLLGDDEAPFDGVTEKQVQTWKRGHQSWKG